MNWNYFGRFGLVILCVAAFCILRAIHLWRNGRHDRAKTYAYGAFCSLITGGFCVLESATATPV